MTVSLEEAIKRRGETREPADRKELNVKVPLDVTAGQQIRLKGQGETAPGHRPGDLLITVTIAPHPFFKVDGSDLRVDLPITLYEAVLAARSGCRRSARGRPHDPQEHLKRADLSASRARVCPKELELARRAISSHHPNHAARWQRRRTGGVDAEMARQRTPTIAQRFRLIVAGLSPEGKGGAASIAATV